MSNPNFDPIYSSNEIYRDRDQTRCLTDDLDKLENDVAALKSAGTVEPLYILSMHLGRLDNNGGAELPSSTRICSDAVAVENGKSYWMVNDKAVNMYVLAYDVDEMFVGFIGNKASGAEISVNIDGAAYLRFGSLNGEYDLTNTFRLYDVDPASASSGGAAGENGATFIPSVSENGDLSWANDKGLENPPTVNIKGATGDQGPAGNDGANGLTPHIGENGHWFIGDTDTGVSASGGSAEGAKGATFTPHVSAEGVISWTNDGGLTNPPSMNIKGATGDQGPKGETGATGPKGETGAVGADGTDGKNGTDGATFTPNVNAAGELSWSNNKGLPNPETVNIKGQRGADGAQGPKGDTGATGPRGETGPMGPRGNQGPQGDRGPQGERGPAGYDGNDFDGNLSGGILRLMGVQAAFNSGSNLVYGSNSMATRIAGNAITATQTIKVDSDKRLKDVKELDMEALRKFAKGVKLVSYIYKHDPNRVEHLGVVAQQLIDLNPDIAKYFVFDRGDGFYSVDYTSLAMLSFLAFQ